ncbi:hypothetical protein KKF86_05245 [bacterium]|nr:hypothetical protein [bacterium]
MTDIQFEKLSNKLYKILAVLIVQGIDNRDDKIYTLKKMGFNSEEISPIMNIVNVRDTEGWKRDLKKSNK